MLTVSSASAATDVTFQIDMTSQPSATSVLIKGSFNGWGTPDFAPLTNNGSGIYSGTYTITDAPGALEACKFYYEPGGNWESINNRQFLLGTGTQVLPLTSWNTSDWPVATNRVTFKVDMSAQVLFGGYTPGQTIRVAGDFSGWGDGLDLTNDVNASGLETNVYSGTFDVTGFLPTTVNYKFRANGGWESPASTAGNNRSATINSANQVLPLVFYNDNNVYDLLQSNTAVTFSVYVPDQTADKDGLHFTKNVDQIFINGDFLGWWGWGAGAAPANAQMFQVGSSDIYTNTFVIPRGNSIYLNYKYSFDGFDDEAGFGTNHIRLIRTYAPSYTLPTDQWTFTLATNPAVNLFTPGTNGIVELDFGLLSVDKPASGLVPVTWLGRPGVVLQTTPSLLGGSWTDQNATDATMGTNWPSAGGAEFFRLKKK